jgi:hypothetical protein
MKWTKEAEDAALAAFNAGSKSDRERLRAALNAAVKEQGISDQRIFSRFGDIAEDPNNPGRLVFVPRATTQQTSAEARAAPDLYEALVKAREWASREGHMPEPYHSQQRKVMAEIDAALAKARGE